MTYLSGQRLVEMRKITEYLLNFNHPDGASKAQFFYSFGFSNDAPEWLLNALSAHPATNRVVSEQSSPRGEKVLVECRMQSVDGRDPCIRTVWIKEGATAPYRLITAYPKS